MRLVKLINGNIVAGEELIPYITFDIPVLPELPYRPDAPKRADYDSPGAFMQAWNDYVVTYVRPWQAVLAEREAAAIAFGQVLNAEFLAAAKLRSGYKLKVPAKGFFVSVAKRLLLYPSDTPIIERILFENF